MTEWCPNGQRFIKRANGYTLTEDSNGSYRVHVTGGECLRIFGTEENARKFLLSLS